MRMWLLGGVCVALLCGAWAGAETLDEAIDRLAKAAAGTRDVTVKYTVQGARYRLPEAGAKPAKVVTMSGTATFQVLRDGDKCLLRLAATITEVRPAKDPAAPPEKREQVVVAVNDGQFSWKEERRSGQDAARVVKEPAHRHGGLGLGSGAVGFLDAAYRTAGIKAAVEELSQEMDVKLAGKGTLVGRPTTTIEYSVKADHLKGMDERLQVMRPIRSVVQLDDATGAALSVQELNGAGDLLRGFVATEVKANSGLDRKLFAYTPPEGAKVQDTTQAPEKPDAPPKAP